jgi:hypothetical protein
MLIVSPFSSHRHQATDAGHEATWAFYGGKTSHGNGSIIMIYIYMFFPLIMEKQPSYDIPMAMDFPRKNGNIISIPILPIVIISTFLGG